MTDGKPDPAVQDAKAATIPARPEGIWSRLNHSRQSIVDWVTVLANLTIVVGLALAVGTYVNETRKTSREAADRRLTHFYSEGLLSARTRLTRLWSGQDLSSLRQGLPRKAIDALVDKTIEGRASNPEAVNEAILVITDYLDGLFQCRESDHCDFQIINRRLGPFSTDFYCTYQGRIVILRERRLLPLLGKNLAQWVADAGGCSANSGSRTQDEG